MKKGVHILFAIAFILGLNSSSFAQYFTVDVVTYPETCAGGKVEIHRSGGTDPVSYNWKDGYYGSQRNNVKAGDYAVTIIDAAGRDTNITFTVKKERCPISISVAFTPNGDGVNDVMGVGEIHLYDNYKLQVFNRWGQKVHEQSGDGKNYIPWDGKQFGINVPDESYYYIFYYDADNKDEVQTGSVSIIR